jgi:hypothetical protein
MTYAGMDAAVAAERLEHSDGGALFHKTYRHLYEGEKREQANRLQALVLDALDEEGTTPREETQKPPGERRLREWAVLGSNQ